MSNHPLLQCINLCKRYQEGQLHTDVLRNVSFAIEPGELMAIVGSSGSGKSTLLHLLGGWIHLPLARLFIRGVRLTNSLPPRKLNCVIVN